MRAFNPSSPLPTRPITLDVTRIRCRREITDSPLRLSLSLGSAYVSQLVSLAQQDPDLARRAFVRLFDFAELYGETGAEDHVSQLDITKDSPATWGRTPTPLWRVTATLSITLKDYNDLRDSRLRRG